MNLSLEGLKEQVSNLSLYGIKAGVRKVQNGSVSPQSHPVWPRCLCSLYSRHELHRDGSQSQGGHEQ